MRFNVRDLAYEITGIRVCQRWLRFHRGTTSPRITPAARRFQDPETGTNGLVYGGSGGHQSAPIEECWALVQQLLNEHSEPARSGVVKALIRRVDPKARGGEKWHEEAHQIVMEAGRIAQQRDWGL